MIHEYIHVGGGALYCTPCEVLVTERDGAAAVQDMKGHESNDPCCEECWAWATGADVDEQTKLDALQDAINAAHERQQWAQRCVFLRKRDECPPPMEGDKPHCPDCSGIVGETGIVW